MITNNQIKLYQAWSLVNNFCGRDQVRFNWFCPRRKKPVAPYAELIKNYDPATRDAVNDQKTIDEYLTQEEIIQLEQYLRQFHRTNLYFEEIPLPAEPGLMPLSSIPADIMRDFYQLELEPGYNMKIPIWGFYNLEECPQTRDAFHGTREEANGVQYIQKVLQALGISSSYSKTLLEDVVRLLFHTEGLYVVSRDR